jgi:hypothetical protein
MNAAYISHIVKVEYFVCCLIGTASTHGCINSSLSGRCNRKETFVQCLSPILWRKGPYCQFYTNTPVPRAGRFISARANSGLCAAASSAGLLYPIYNQHKVTGDIPESMQFEHKHREMYSRLHQSGNCHTIFHNPCHYQLSFVHRGHTP